MGVTAALSCAWSLQGGIGGHCALSCAWSLWGGDGGHCCTELCPVSVGCTWGRVSGSPDCPQLLCPPPALWEATRVLMLLSVLMATAGLAVGLCAAAGTAWRVRVRAAGVTLFLAGLLALLGLGLYTAGTPSLLGPARAAWRFSWSYILGWVAAVLISSAGLFHLCAAAKDPSPESSEVTGS
uniref:Lens fiber membrane intrinsic protein n=1 Tax=Strigops habroptila TaxID=2489341 RepID=A0A672UNI0_STRHB